MTIERARSEHWVRITETYTIPAGVPLRMEYRGGEAKEVTIKYPQIIKPEYDPYVSYFRDRRYHRLTVGQTLTLDDIKNAPIKTVVRGALDNGVWEKVNHNAWATPGVRGSTSDLDVNMGRVIVLYVSESD